tara:strand:+ start:235 stop:588 length:354 start_codon:yes stop_codon:yes gene_type:complete
MRTSSPRIKALTVTIGVSFWFFIITTTTQVFSIEIFLGFVAIILFITQIFAFKLSKALDKFAIINSKIFLGIVFIFVISLYGIFFKILKIDLFRQKPSNSYWLEMEELDDSRILRQY